MTSDAAQARRSPETVESFEIELPHARRVCSEASSHVVGGVRPCWCLNCIRARDGGELERPHNTQQARTVNEQIMHVAGSTTTNESFFPPQPPQLPSLLREKMTSPTWVADPARFRTSQGSGVQCSTDTIPCRASGVLPSSFPPFKAVEGCVPSQVQSSWNSSRTPSGLAPQPVLSQEGWEPRLGQREKFDSLSSRTQREESNSQ